MLGALSNDCIIVIHVYTKCSISFELFKKILSHRLHYIKQFIFRNPKPKELLLWRFAKSDLSDINWIFLCNKWKGLIFKIYVTAAGSVSPVTSTLPVNGYWLGMQWEATAATGCKQNTLLYFAGLTCLTKRQWVLFYPYSLLPLPVIWYYE